MVEGRRVVGVRLMVKGRRWAAGAKRKWMGMQRKGQAVGSKFGTSEVTIMARIAGLRGHVLGILCVLVLMLGVEDPKLPYGKP